MQSIFIFYLVSLLMIGVLVSKKQFFSLYFIYVLIWTISVALLPMFSSILNHKISEDIVSFLNFHAMFGMVFYFILDFSKKDKKPRPVIFFNSKYLKFVRIVIYISIIFSVLFAINILSKYSYLLFNNPWKLREMYFNGEVSIFLSTSYTIIFLYCSAILGSSVVYFKQDYNNKIYYLPLLSAIIFAFVYIGRNEFVKVALIYLIAFVLKNKKIIFLKSFKKIAAILAVIIILSSILNKGNHITNTNSGLINNTLTNIGSYGSGSLLVFDEFTQRSSIDFEYGLGEYTFYPIFRRLSSIGLYKDNFEVSYVDDYTLFINTFTYLRPFYSDFGWFGVYILSSLFVMLLIYFTQIDNRPRFLKKYIIFISLYPAVLFSIQGLEYQTIEYFTAIIIALIVNFLSKFRVA